MEETNKFCKVMGHEDFLTLYICTLESCKESQRWCCKQCLLEGTHEHSTIKLAHITPFKEVMVKKAEEINKIQSEHNQHSFQYRKQLQSIAHQTCQKLQQFIQDYQWYVKQKIQNINKEKDTLSMYISNLNERNFIDIEESLLNEILFVNKNEYVRNMTSLLKPFEIIDDKINSFQTIFDDNQDNKHQIDYDKLLKYSIKQIDQTKETYYASQISNNEQYLAYGGSDMALIIYDIKKDQIIKTICLISDVFVCQFSFDSSLLFIGCDLGIIYGYDVQKDFCKIFQSEIQLSVQMMNLRVIKNKYIIACSHNEYIYKFEIKSQKEIFRMHCHSDQIGAFDYDEQADMIVSGSVDKSIKFQECKTQIIIINHLQSHLEQIRQMQLINNNKCLLSLDDLNNLYKWQIDLINKKLIKIFVFNDRNKIFNFYKVNQDQNLIIICGGYFKILNHQGETICQIYHNAGKGIRFPKSNFINIIEFYSKESRQLENGTLIHIRSESNINQYTIDKIMLAILSK